MKRGPKTNGITLSAVDPVSLSAEVVQLVQAHVARLVVPLSPGVEVSLCGDGATTLGMTIESLVAYAPRGELGDWQDHACALDAIQEVCSVLYARPAEPGTFGLGELEETATVSSPLGMVLVGAYGRAQIELGHRVTVKALAVLAEVTPKVVQASDDLAPMDRGTRPWTYRAKDAKRWLRARSLAGF